MFIKIQQNVFNLNSITAMTRHGTGQWMMIRVFLLGGGFVDINKNDAKVLLSALKDRMSWYGKDEVSFD